jgi:hypothetical protein
MMQVTQKLIGFVSQASNVVMINLNRCNVYVMLRSCVSFSSVILLLHFLARFLYHICLHISSLSIAILIFCTRNFFYIYHSACTHS